jgi:hypothetical protein
MVELQHQVRDKQSRLIAGSRTAKLWILYMRMLDIVKHLLAGDRGGSWQMYLAAMKECLPVFAAAGHTSYLKSAYHYLQSMAQLGETHPEVHQKFLEGFHVVRRSDKFWSGVSSDLVIEQSLMRSLKSKGWLTHGSRMSDEMTAHWTLSPISSEYTDAMQRLSGVTFTSSEQHKKTAIKNG